jgi:predicted nucleotidyltransferase
MLDSMSAYDAQRVKLEECIVLASKIAACEADERIKRATVMYCMERTVDGFPVSLSLSSRRAS